MSENGLPVWTETHKWLLAPSIPAWHYKAAALDFFLKTKKKLSKSSKALLKNTFWKVGVFLEPRSNRPARLRWRILTCTFVASFWKVGLAVFCQSSNAETVSELVFEIKKENKKLTLQLFWVLEKNNSFLVLQKQFWKKNRRREICAWSASSAKYILSRQKSATTKRRSKLKKFSLLKIERKFKMNCLKLKPFKLSGALILDLRDFDS